MKRTSAQGARPARNKPKAPGERLPVRAGWRFGYPRAPLMAGMGLAGI